MKTNWNIEYTINVDKASDDPDYSALKVTFPDIQKVLSENSIKDILAEEDAKIFEAINNAVGITTTDSKNIKGPGIPVDPEHKKVKKPKQKDKKPEDDKGDVIEVF